MAYRSGAQGFEANILELQRLVASREAEVQAAAALMPRYLLRRLARARSLVERADAEDPLALMKALEQQREALEEAVRALAGQRRDRAQVPQLVPPPHTLRGGPRPPLETIASGAYVRDTPLGALINKTAQVLPWQARGQAEVFAVNEVRERPEFTRELLPEPRSFVCARFEHDEAPLSLAWEVGGAVTLATSVARRVPELHLRPRRFLSLLLRVFSSRRPVRMGHRELDRAFDLTARGSQAADVVVDPSVRAPLLELARIRRPTLRIHDCVAELWWRCGSDAPGRQELKCGAGVLTAIRSPQSSPARSSPR
jgi:hypothetical protein